ADTVIQFPPFTMDMVFLRKALEIARNVYSIHKLTEATKKKVEAICKKYGARMKLEKKFRYKVPWEEKGKIGYEVFLLVAKR
ncbi:MAG TPA: methyltransferase type 11, partial [archaeon]|nr:methyltransferase type 11 [archaeon]